MAYIPLFFEVGQGHRIVMVGGGNTALAKAESLRRVAGNLHVVAESVLPELTALLRNAGGSVAVQPYAPGVLDGAKLAIVATNDAELNLRVQRDARERGVPVNVVDAPDLCDFIFPAVVSRGDVQIAISTSGVNPTLARLLKRRIEMMLPWNFSAIGSWLRERRSQVKARLQDLQARRLFWDAVLSGPIPEEVIEGNLARADLLLAQALERTPAESRAALYLIGAGPGHPDLVSVRATQLLSRADVILFDRLIPHDVLERYARRDARKIAVGKSRADHLKTQEEIGLLIESHLRQGRIVARLKGGDPGIYAHSAEEIDIAIRLGVPYQIVPGITAATGCAALAGIPLTERGIAPGVRILTLYDEDLHDPDYWRSLGSGRKDTLVFYMSTRHRSTLCRRLIEAGFPEDTPIVVIEQGTTPQQREHASTLASLNACLAGVRLITPALIIVGQVARHRNAHGWREKPVAMEAYFGDPAEEGRTHATH